MFIKTCDSFLPVEEAHVDYFSPTSDTCNSFDTFIHHFLLPFWYPSFQLQVLQNHFLIYSWNAFCFWLTLEDVL